MQTIAQLVESNPNCSYSGNMSHWCIAASLTRDSDIVDQSNWRVIRSQLAELPDTIATDTFTVVSMSHWASSWVDYLVINPEINAAMVLVESLHTRLADYPVLDDTDYYELENDEIFDHLDTIETELKSSGHCSNSPIVWEAQNFYTYTTICSDCDTQFLYAHDSKSYPDITNCPSEIGL